MITFDIANKIFEENPTVFGRKVFGDMVLFDYYYKDYALFNSDPYIRDLRGVVFTETGELASLPFHAFFNVGESDKQLTYNGYYSEKQDGSMLQLSSHNGRLIVGSRSSLSGYVAQSAPVSPELEEFIHENGDYTFLFEFLDPGHMIVLRHTEPELVFLAARSKITGAYRHDFSPPGTRENPVRELRSEMWDSLEDELRNSTEREGIVMWTDNDFWKYKIEWYVDLHKITTVRSPVNYLTAWQEGTLDDSISVLARYGRHDLVAEIHEVVNAFTLVLSESVNRITDVALTKETAKDIALSVSRENTVDSMVFGSVMKAFRGGYLNDRGLIFQTVRDSLGTMGIKRYLQENE